MPVDKYPSIFSCKMKAIVYIFLHQMEDIVSIKSTCKCNKWIFKRLLIVSTNGCHNFVIVKIITSL